MEFDLDKFPEEIGRLTKIPPPPKGGSSAQYAEYYSQLAENFKKAVALMEEFQKRYPVVKLKKDYTQLLEKYKQYVIYFEATAKYYATLAKIDGLIEEYEKTKKDPNQVLEAQVQLYKEALGYLTSINVNNAEVMKQVNGLVLHTMRKIVSTERRLIATHYIDIGKTLAKLVQYQQNIIMDPINGMDANEISQVYGLDVMILQDAVDLASTALEMFKKAQNYFGDTTNNEFTSLFNMVQKLVVFYSKSTEFMKALQKFYELIASLPQRPQPGSPKEQFMKYYDEMERILTSALEVIKPYKDIQGVSNAYNYYQSLLDKTREERSKLIGK